MDFVSLESYEEKMLFCDWKKSNFAKLIFALDRISNILFVPQKLMPYFKLGISLKLLLLKKVWVPACSDWNVHLLLEQIFANH